MYEASSMLSPSDALFQTLNSPKLSTSASWEQEAQKLAAKEKSAKSASWHDALSGESKLDGLMTKSKPLNVSKGHELEDKPAKISATKPSMLESLKEATKKFQSETSSIKKQLANMKVSLLNHCPCSIGI